MARNGISVSLQVDFSTACVTKSPIIGHAIKYPPAELGTAMKTNYNNNKNLLWQHYGTKDGTSIIYPATYWTHCNSYDPRLRYLLFDFGRNA